MRFARFVLLAQALVMACLSLAYWLRPYEMANLNGMLLMEEASVSHMRVYYGGLQLGLAAFLIWIYWASCLFLYGASLVATLGKRREEAAAG